MTAEKSWLLTDKTGSIHVHPVSDVIKHKLARDCWCAPRQDAHVLVHNSLDTREIFEP